MELAKVERDILNHLQSGLPIVQRPFLELAEALGISETEAVETTRRLRERGFIRRLGGIFDARAMGFHSTLCAAEVDRGRCRSFAETVNRFDEVTHNYRRDGRFNVWFTITARDQGVIRQIISRIETETGVHVVEFPTGKCYKIKAEFPL